MEEKNLWSDVFHAISRIENIKNDLEVAVNRRDKEIAILYRNGIPKAQLARRIELSRPTVNKIIKEQDIDHSC